MLIILDILISVADILSLALLLYIIHFYTQPNTNQHLPILPHWLSSKQSLWPIALFLLLFSAKNAAGFLVFRAQSRFIARIASRLSRNKLMQYQEGSYLDYIQIDSAVQIRRISHYPVEFSQYIVGGVQQIITQSVLILLSIAGILLFNPQLFLLLFAILLPPVLAVFYLIKKRSKKIRVYAQSSIEKALQHLQEALSGFVEGNVYNKNQAFLERYMNRQQQFNHYLSDLLTAQGIPARMIEVFALIGLFLLLAIYQWSGSGDTSALITIGAFMAAAYKIIPGVVKILNISGQINTYNYTIHELLPRSAERAGTIEQPALASTPTTRIQTIRFANVKFAYGQRAILEKINFQVEKGDMLGIAGRSGRGKTTIIHLLLGFLSPQAGNIIFNGTITDTNNRKQFWPRIAYVKQQPFLVHDTFQHNITLNGHCHEQQLQEAVHHAGLADLVRSFPDGVQQVVAEQGKNISGGQRQRIAIARALYKEADLIILDEPFNELDAAAEQALLQYFKELALSGKIIILITHNQQSLAHCNKLINLDEA